ncbi:MAG: DNA-binding transcriptional activator of the family [Devosia sp.]|uniref:BTAD domain-containing putative transcriptional regulator n=1 Tax=Devosia sp. TaxID=1871048 RepID=UPI0026194A91|nr:BTAD domain-containing putative transcriptional regulator [Devosia sp.]MDB5528448.1 DNA-binding transcriptional activator of the family [Devosia sp.]
METAASDRLETTTSIAITMLGPLTLLRGGVAADLPASRKTRALLAYLALSPRPVSRSHLCELLWEVPNDPRGELRWCLSKLRGLLDEPGHVRVRTAEDRVWLDMAGCSLDVAALGALSETTAQRPAQEVIELWAGEFLDGLALDRSPGFQAWLTGQRRHWRRAHISLLERAIAEPSRPASHRLALIERWVALSPFDERAHVLLLAHLRQSGTPDAAEAHLRTTVNVLEAEGLDTSRLRTAWRDMQGTVVASIADADPSPKETLTIEQIGRRHRASLAIMPFVQRTHHGPPGGGLADGLTQDIITRLARLRSLFVIARGSVYALAESGLGPIEAAQKLNVDYVTSGAIEVRSDSLSLTIELIEVRSGRIVWSERFERVARDALAVLDEVGNQIVASIASEIETVERNLAILKPPSSLNAWEAYHRGLWHMYRFTKTENETARHFFQQSVGLDPTFARAYAGLSFTHWQSGFQHWGDRAEDRDQAYAAAGEAMIADDHDPAAHWAMGRALWMRGQEDQSLVELEQAIDLSPNFALGHYALSFVLSQSGDPQAAISAADHSRQLSPFDPLLFGMLGARAMAHVRLGQFEEAAQWALKAAARPNAHPTIMAIAAHCLALAGRLPEARVIMAGIHATLPSYSIADFLDTFRFSADAEAEFRRAARLISG